MKQKMTATQRNLSQPCSVATIAPPKVNIRSSDGAVFVQQNGNNQGPITAHQIPGLPCMTCSNAQTPTQPDTTDWLDRHSGLLLEAIRTAAPDQVNNQLEWEANAGADMRLKIEMRTETLRKIALYYLNRQ